jgi:hypothetical protein
MQHLPNGCKLGILAYEDGFRMAETQPKKASDILQSYRRWKEEGEALKTQAQGFLVERFHDLIQEAQQVQQDLWDDFGHSVKFPANPKFAKKAKARGTGKKSVAAARPAGTGASGAGGSAAGGATKSSASQKPMSSGAPLRAPATEPIGRLQVPVSSGTPRPPRSMSAGKGKGNERTLAQLTRQVEKARQRLEEAKASGSAVKIQNAEDRLYELSDELRLLNAGG